MWLKVVLLGLCLLALFIISRILEATLFFETGLFSTTILDPVTLSVRQLKRILETRGISYVGVLEKPELTTLVETSGHIMEGELVESTGEDASGVSLTSTATHFTCGSHFYEEVEDTKDSVWLVQVIPYERPSLLLDDYNWRQVMAQLKPFGIRTGVLNCHLDKRLCNRKEWHTPQLVLALPRGSRAKDSVLFHSTSSVSRVDSVVSWVKDQLASRLKVIDSIEELEQTWLKIGEDASPNIHVVALSRAKEPPLFFSSLSMKFAGRALFGIAYDLDLSKWNDTISSLPKIRPAYLVITPEGVFPYGSRSGQHLNFRSMEFFLRTLQPELNDVFIITLMLVNLMACFDFFLIDGKLWKHLVKCFWMLVKYNCIHFLSWLAILGLSHFQFIQVTADVLLKLTRTATFADFSSSLWCSLRFWRSIPHVSIGLMLTMCGINAWIRRKWFANQHTGNISVAFSLDNYIMNCFFRPMATLTRPVTIDLDFAEEMELLIGRLAMPNLWLQPVSHHREYIETLPLWRYRVHSDEESSEQSSDTEKSVEGYGSNSETDCANVQNLSQRSAFMRRLVAEFKAFYDKFLKLKARYFFNTFTRTQQLIKLGDPLPDTIVSPECAICLESYESKDILCGLPCGHNYHQHCILGWLLRDKHHCPTCRWPSYKSRPENDRVHSPEEILQF